jgi:TetR/AcrR family transcriptional regulator, tetracycline repressor protein
MASQGTRTHPHPQSSNRPSKDLTRVKVIEAGLELIDREGPDAMTMRRLAASLGVTPMALYNHVSSKKDLLQAVAEHVLGQTEFDGHREEWREQIEYCFRMFRRICLRHPGLARLLEIADVAPATVFAPMEVTLRALDQAGLNSLDSLRTYFTLVSFTLGQASYESRGPFPDLEPSKKVRSERLAGRGYRTVEHLETPEKWDFEAAFEFGLSLVLGGVESAARSKQAL